LGERPRTIDAGANLRSEPHARSGETFGVRVARRIAGAIAFLALLWLLVRFLGKAPDAVRDRVRAARLGPVLIGLLVYALAYAARAVEARAPPPDSERAGFLRSLSVSGATTFLLQIVPFRGASS